MKNKLLTALACLMLAASLLVGCAETEKAAETDGQTEQNEQVEQNKNEEEIQGEAESDSQYKPTTVSDPDAPSFEDIYNANQMENILSIYEGVKYVNSYDDEEDGEYITANGIFTEISLPKKRTVPDEPGDLTNYNDIWKYYFQDYQESVINGYAFYNHNTYYVSDGTDIYAVIDPTDYYTTKIYYDHSAEFYGYDAESVESITKTETGWQIKFIPDAENAQYFRNEEYQEGDVLVTYEYVDENLILDYYTQVIECADGTVQQCYKNTLVKDGLPEIAKEMMKHANPSVEDREIAVVFLDDGMGYVEPKSVVISKGDRVEVLTDGYLVYSDRAYTSTEFDPDSENKVYYAVSPLSLFMSPEEYFLMSDAVGYMITAYDKDGKNVAKNMMYDYDGWNESWLYGNFNDESIAYVKCVLYDKEQNVFGDVLRIDK